ncbi:hypothetical protein OAV88_02090 [bacterium]|nr:hypothetical protein [bacterium]
MISFRFPRFSLQRSNPPAMARRIKYYFDVISPYTAFSWQVMRRYSKRWRDLHDVEIEYVPVSKR